VVLIYFQKIHSLDFSIICLWKTEKNTGLLTLVSWNFGREIFCILVVCILTFSANVLSQISIFVCRRATRVLDWYLPNYMKFQRTVPCQCISTKPCRHNFLVNCACVAFNRVLDPCKQSQKGRVFSNTFNTYKNKRFSHITNCLIVKTESNTQTIFTG